MTFVGCLYPDNRFLALELMLDLCRPIALQPIELPLCQQQIMDYNEPYTRHFSSKDKGSYGYPTHTLYRLSS